MRATVTMNWCCLTLGSSMVENPHHSVVSRVSGTNMNRELSVT